MVKVTQQADGTWKVAKPQGTWIWGPDRHHAPDNDPNGGVDMRALGCMIQAIGIVKPDGFGDLGDIGEWTSVSPWQYKRRKRPGMSKTIDMLYDDIEAVHAGQDLVDAELAAVGCTRKIQIEGNHEVWVDNMIEEWRDDLGRLMDPNVDTAKLLDLKKRNYAYIPYGEYVRLGKLFLYHGGHYGGENHAMAHVKNLGASVMYAHHHGYQVAKRAKLGEGVHAAWCMGFLGKTRKPFLKGRPTNWSHNFAIVHVEKDGTFHVEPVEIFDGKCYVYGKKVVG